MNISGLLVNAYLAEGGEAVGRSGGRILRGRRNARWLPLRNANAGSNRARFHAAARRPSGIDYCRAARQFDLLQPLTRVGSDPMRLFDSKRYASESRSLRSLVPQYRSGRASRPRPNHFLGDYPNVKWSAVRRRASSRSLGKDRPRHRLQRRILFDPDETPRRRTRARQSIPTPTIWRRLASPPRSRAARSRSRFCRSMTWAPCVKAVRPRPVHGCSLSPSPSAARPRSHSRDTSRDDLLVFQSMLRGSGESRDQIASNYDFWDQRSVQAGGFSKATLHRAELCRRSEQLVGAESCLFGSHAAKLGVRHPLATRRGSLRLPRG